MNGQLDPLSSTSKNSTLDKNGNYVLKWNNLQTGEERYNQYKMYERAVAEGGACNYVKQSSE